jgi:hypothetical protein
MEVEFRAQLGHVVLIEEDRDESAPLTGLVVAVGDHALTVDLTSPTPPDLAGCSVYASVFAPEALYRARADVLLDADGFVTLADIRDVEIVQRRRWPRRAIHLPVSLVPVDDGAEPGVTGETLDIGVGGAQVRTGAALPPGLDPMVVITMPDGEVLLVPSHIVFATKGDEGFTYRVAFQDVDDAIAGRLSQLVSRVPA